MAGKQAKVLFDHHVHALLAYSHHSRYPVRNRVIVLLSVKAGLRAGEIANLTWLTVVDPSGDLVTRRQMTDIFERNLPFQAVATFSLSLRYRDLP